jgi:hypothetical protein
MIRNRDIIVGNIWYWVLTNLYCYIIWYTHDVKSLVNCYLLAVPFYFTALAKTWALIRAVELCYNGGIKCLKRA